MKAFDRDYARLVEEFASYLNHYKSATGSSDYAIARESGLSQTTINRVKRGLVSPNLKSFYRVLAATGRDDPLGDGVLAIKLRTVGKVQPMYRVKHQRRSA